jgi:PilZ domain
MPEQLFQTADSLPAPQPNIECRVYKRDASEFSVSCQPTSAWGRKDARWPAAIDDISQGGICLIVRRRFEPGAGLGIELPGRDGDDPYTVLAKVIHVRALPDGSWALGCKFISELSEDEVEHLTRPQHTSSLQQPVVATPKPIAPSQHPKVTSSSKVVEDASAKKTVSDVNLQLEIPPGEGLACRIQRLTVPGAWPLATGKMLALSANTPNGPLISLRLEVVRCRLEGEIWTLRCRLLDPPSASLLRTLRRPAQ